MWERTRQGNLWARLRLRRHTFPTEDRAFVALGRPADVSAVRHAPTADGPMLRGLSPFSGYMLHCVAQWRVRLGTDLANWNSS